MKRTRLLCIVMALCISIPWYGFAQSRTVSGTVTDAQNSPLPGVSVVIKGTTKGTATNANGEFSLEYQSPDDILVFSFVGFEPAEVRIGTQSVMQVTLAEDISTLQEIVVIGYGEVKKSDLTGSLATVKGDNLNRTPSVSVDQLLQGKAAGLQVIAPSGEPGAGATVRIRGLSSFNGSNSPLVVVDGFPWGDAGNLKQINPEDIESIEILKDASASAIYGSRGANGVILITTRKGREGQSRLTLSTLTTVSTLANKLDVWGDPVEVAIIDNEARTNAGLAPLFVGADYLGTYYPSVAELRGLDPDKARWPHRTYWPDLVYRNPVSQSYTLSAEGGNDKTKYSLSGNYYKEEGLAIKNGYDRYNARVNLDQQVHRKITLGTNLIVTHTNRTGGGLSAGRSPVFPVYNDAGEYFKIGPLDFGHPLAHANEVLNENKSIDVLGTLYAQVRITDWLEFRSQLSNKYGNSISDRYEPRDVTYNGYQFVGFGTIDNWSGNELLNENYFTLKKDIGNAHHVTVMAGYTTQVSSARGSRLEGHGFVNDNLKNENMNAAQDQINSNWLSKSVLNSWIGRASYSLHDKYLLTVTGRADGSSKFGANNKWAFFPSAAVAWKLHEEQFLSAVRAVSEAKVRVSYGVSGNQGLSPYQTLDRLGSGKYYTGGDFQIGYGPGIYDWDGYNKIWGGVPNTSLKWETTSQFDIGMDIGLFDQRLTITLDYYEKNTTDLLRQSFISPSSGYDRLWINDGKVNNRGLEISLQGDVISRDAFTWNVGGNFTMNRNKVVDTGFDDYVWNGSTIEMLRSPINVLVTGQPFNAYYGYKTDGIIQTEAEGIEAGLVGDMARPGEIKYLDISGPEGIPDGVVDANDRTIIGSPNPDFIYSINTRFTYKRFDLSVQLYGVYGNDVFDFQKFSPSRQLQRWTPDNPTNAFPRVHATRGYHGSDWFITDGSFLRVQNVTIGYNFRDGLVPGISSLRVYFSGNNLHTFTRFNPGFDPEVPENGQHWGSYPRPRALSLGLNIGF